jgi:solute carrier family 34 (sodium-dependent phosphate cotransporter)
VPLPKDFNRQKIVDDAAPAVTDVSTPRSRTDGEAVIDVAAQERTSRWAPQTRGARPQSTARLILFKGLSFLAAVFLFILALQLMKTGARAVAPSIKGSFLFDNGISTLGFGWISAYVVLSGSPVAATSLTMFDGGILSPLQTFTMLSGSRLGASFIVLLTGFLYALRNKGRNRSESIGMGIQALSLTAVVYLPGMLIGYWLLRSGSLSGIRWHASEELLSLVDVIWGPVEEFIRGLVPGYTAAADSHPELWIMLPAGLGILLVSFKLLDRVLPQLASSERHADSRTHWLKRPWPMFLLGCVVATLTLSVSVALTLLVPLASKGYIKKKEAIPYIMGANITTLADTLVAAMILGNAVAVQIVLAEAIGVSIVTIFYLALIYRPLSGGIMALDDWIVTNNVRLWSFVAVLFVLPAILLSTGFYL